MMVTSVLQGGDGSTISYSLVAMFRRFLSHPIGLAAALMEVMMLQYLQIEDTTINQVKSSPRSLMAARMSLATCFLLRLVYSTQV